MFIKMLFAKTLFVKMKQCHTELGATRGWVHDQTIPLIIHCKQEQFYLKICPLLVSVQMCLCSTSSAIDNLHHSIIEFILFNSNYNNLFWSTFFFLTIVLQSEVIAIIFNDAIIENLRFLDSNPLFKFWILCFSFH